MRRDGDGGDVAAAGKCWPLWLWFVANLKQTAPCRSSPWAARAGGAESPLGGGMVPVLGDRGSSALGSCAGEDPQIYSLHGKNTQFQEPQLSELVGYPGN